jgi:hypothetical protein
LFGGLVDEASQAITLGCSLHAISKHSNDRF